VYDSRTQRGTIPTPTTIRRSALAARKKNDERRRGREYLVARIDVRRSPFVVHRRSSFVTVRRLSRSHLLSFAPAPRASPPPPPSPHRAPRQDATDEALVARTVEGSSMDAMRTGAGAINVRSGGSGKWRKMMSPGGATDRLFDAVSRRVLHRDGAQHTAATHTH
jgi:hypothetical protein